MEYSNLWTDPPISDEEILAFVADERQRMGEYLGGFSLSWAEHNEDDYEITISANVCRSVLSSEGHASFPMGRMKVIACISQTPSPSNPDENPVNELLDEIHGLYDRLRPEIPDLKKDFDFPVKLGSWVVYAASNDEGLFVDESYQDDVYCGRVSFPSKKEAISCASLALCDAARKPKVQRLQAGRYFYHLKDCDTGLYDDGRLVVQVTKSNQEELRLAERVSR